jgi:hypothetical protein
VEAGAARVNPVSVRHRDATRVGRWPEFLLARAGMGVELFSAGVFQKLHPASPNGGGCLGTELCASSDAYQTTCI